MHIKSSLIELSSEESNIEKQQNSIETQLAKTFLRCQHQNVNQKLTKVFKQKSIKVINLLFFKFQNPYFSGVAKEFKSSVYLTMYSSLSNIQIQP